MGASTRNQGAAVDANTDEICDLKNHMACLKAKTWAHLSLQGSQIERLNAQMVELMSLIKNQHNQPPTINQMGVGSQSPQEVRMQHSDAENSWGSRFHKLYKMDIPVFHGEDVLGYSYKIKT